MHTITADTPITIAIVKRPHDWQRIINTRHYHLPIQHLTRITHTAWIAFYMPGWYTQHAHCIQHVATISAHTIMSRHQYLPDEQHHPRAHQPYIILTIDTIYTLTLPIPSRRWRRVSVQHSTWGALVRADDLGSITRIERHIRTAQVTVTFDDIHDICIPTHVPHAEEYTARGKYTTPITGH